MEELTTKRSYQSIYKLLSWLFILGVFCVLIASYWSLTYYPRVFYR